MKDGHKDTHLPTLQRNCPAKRLEKALLLKEAVAISGLFCKSEGARRRVPLQWVSGSVGWVSAQTTWLADAATLSDSRCVPSTLSPDTENHLAAGVRRGVFGCEISSFKSAKA